MGFLPPEPRVVVTVTPRWSPCAGSRAWSPWGLQDDGTALLPTAPLTQGFLHGDFGKAGLNNSPIKACAEHLLCGR